MPAVTVRGLRLPYEEYGTGPYSVTRPCPATPGTGQTGGAATKRDHTGTTSKHDGAAT